MAEKKKEEIIEEVNEPEKKVRITIHSTRDEDGPVFVSVNERTWLIQRDVEVEVPVSVAKVIEQSIRANREINKARRASAVK